MGAKKIKGVKKNAVRTDEILTLAQRAKAWFENNQLIISGVLGAVVLFIAILWGFNAYGEARERRAQTAYARVFEKWPAEHHEDPKQWENLIPELGNFIKSYQGTAAALNAELDLCQSYNQAKHYEDAIKRCENVLRDSSAGLDLKSLARYQLALSYENIGKTADAINQWDALRSEGPESFTREADWRLARIHAKNQEYSRAVEQYELALKTSGIYPPSALLQEELASTKAKAEGSGNARKEVSQN